MKKYVMVGVVAVVCIGALIWQRQTGSGNSGSRKYQAATSSPMTLASTTLATNAVNPSNVPAAAALAKTNSTVSASTSVQVSREFDLSVNPYAAALREPGKSKREWDASFIENFQQAKAGDPVKFELTGGVMAEGSIKILQLDGGKVAYVSGELTAPETGKFFFLTPPVGGKAGKAVGVIEFPASKTAYRIEPTGINGDPELWRRRLDEVICMDMKEADPATLQAAAEAAASLTENITPLRPDLAPNYVPSYNSNIVSLQSCPGSPAVLLLDFAGGYTPTWGGVTYVRPLVSNATIKDVWKRVAEDYMPFNINVTTDLKVFQAAAQGGRQRCCFTSTPVTAAGVAYIGSWNWGGDTPCWSVYYVGKPAGEVGAHEPGHTLGLSHQTQDVPNGTNAPTHNEYYGGQGSGQTGWAPIMGVGYYQPLSTWAKGEYQYAGQTQDELQIITTANNNVHYRTDDTGSTLATSRYLEAYTNTTVSAEGVIEQTADTDAFQFTTAGGVMTLTANPVAVGDWADLAVMATLADATDTVIASNNVQNVTTATITTNLPAGTYTFRVTGAGKNDPLTTGFSSYASLGYYSITGSVAGVRLPTRLSVLSMATNGTVVGPVPPIGSGTLAYAIVGGNLGGAFVIDNSGVLTVANNSQINYNQLVTNAQYFVGLEVFVNITNQGNPSLTELNRRVVVSVLPTPPVLIGFTTSLMEHIPAGLVVGSMTVSNLGIYTAPTFSFIAGNTGGMFAIDANGVITTAGDLNAATQSVYNLSVLLNDGEQPTSMTATGQVTINVVGNTPFVWNGAGGNNNWSSSANWSSPLLGVGPQVTFGATLRQVNTNDAASSLTWAQFTAGGFSIYGNPVLLQSGITNVGNNTWGLATTVHAPQTWYAASGTLTVSGTVTNNGYVLNAGGAGGVVFNGYLTGSGGLTKIGSGILTLANAGNDYTGNVVISNGTVMATVSSPAQNPTTSALGNPQVARTLTVASGATLAFANNDVLGRALTQPLMAIVVDGGTVTNTGNYIDALGPVTLKNGAVLTGNGGNSAGYQMYSLQGTVTAAGTNASTITSGPFANSGYHLFAPTVFDVADVTGNASVDLTVSGTLIDRNGDWSPTTGSLTKIGAGTLALNAANTYTGPTTVNNGTLQVKGSLATGSAVTVNGGTLAGTGTVNGPTTIQPGGMLAPGTNGIGTLKVNNTLTLGGTVRMEIGKNGAALAGDLINGISTLTCGGTLVVTNLGPSALAAGDTFTFFSASGFTGAFNSIALPVLSSGLAWNITNVNVNGSATVITVGSGSPPPVPAGVTVSVGGVNQINVDWSASAGAVNYVINRDGADISAVAGTHFSDTGLAVNSSHCYTLVAVGGGGSSLPSASVCGNPAPVGGTLAWDMNLTTSGAQDGSGVWGVAGTNWLYGTQDLIWYDNNIASFGVSTTTNCAITLTNDVAPAGIIFNAAGGGSYTISGSNSILTDNSPVITTIGNATIATLLTGAAGSVTKTGAGTLTLANAASSFTANVAVSNGTVLVNVSSPGPNPVSSALGNPQVARTVTVTGGATLAVANNDVFGNALTLSAMSIVLDGGVMTNTGNYFVTLGPVTLKNGARLTGNGGNSANVQMYALQGTVTAAGTNASTITSGGAANSGYNLSAPTIFDVADVTGSPGVDLTVSGVLIDRPNDWIATTTLGALTKIGAGTLALNAVNAYTGSTTVSNGTLLVMGSLAAGSTVSVAGGTLAGTGTVNGPTTIQSGGVLAPGTNGIGTLKINNTLTMSPNSTALMEVNLTGGVANSDFVTGLAGVAYNGSLIVTNTSASPLPAGAVFCLFNSATAGIGNFSSVTILPTGTGSFNPTNGQLTIGSPQTNNLLCYESFPYPAGASLVSLNGGYGWNGGWQAIDNTGALLVNGGSLTAGGNATGGYDALSTGNAALANTTSRAGRWLDTSATGSFGARGFIDGNGHVGADGKVLYVSFLEQPGTTVGNAFYEFEFHRGNLGDPGRIAGIGNDTGVANSVNLRAPNTVNNLSLGTATTGVNFYVMKIVYHSGNDDIYVYRNPTNATEAANTPTLTKLAQADMSFDGLSMAAYNGGATIKVDEIRLGESWASVAVNKVYTPHVNSVVFSGGNVVLTGSGGAPGGGYTWLTSTNVAAPLAAWTTNSAGLFDGSGALSNSIPVAPSESSRYFRLRSP